MATGAPAPAGPKPDVACATVMGGHLLASIKATGPARVKLRAWPAGQPSNVVESNWFATNAADTAKIDLDTARPSAGAWEWQGVVQDSSGALPAVSDAVRTVPGQPAQGAPSAFTFAFGSCILQGRRAPALNVVRASGAKFFALIGDLGYMDASPDMQNYASYLNLFRGLLAHADLGPVIATMPFYGMQDDHDYGQDDCWSATVKPYAAQPFADLIPGAAYPGPSYRMWSVGEADFFLTDNRRYRENPSRPFANGRYPSQLGQTQRTWLLQSMAASRAKVKVVFLPMTMAWYWWSADRDDLLRDIAASVTGTVIFCSGDKHAGGFVRYNSRCYELLAGPISNPKKHNTPTRPYVIWTENGTGRALYNCVGLVDIDTSTQQKVTLRLVREDGVELHRESVPL